MNPAFQAQAIISALAVLAEMDDTGSGSADKNYQEYKPPEPLKKGGNAVRRNDRCPCGSGKKFKNCCVPD